MNLIADIGNTKSKFAIFDKTEMIDFRNFNEDEEKAQLSYLKNLTSIKNVIQSNVGVQFELNPIFPSANFLFLDSKTPLPIKNLYNSPSTLGSDRIALAVRGYTDHPNQNLLIIDMGTCITLDFVNKKGQYLGGSISPGMALRFKALNNYTSQLPLLSFSEENFPKIIGGNTKESIKTGVIMGIVNEIKGFETAYAKMHDNLTILFTGGDYPLLEHALNQALESKKNKIFTDPFLTVRGLNAILDYNENL